MQAPGGPWADWWERRATSRRASSGLARRCQQDGAHKQHCHGPVMRDRHPRPKRCPTRHKSWRSHPGRKHGSFRPRPCLGCPGVNISLGPAGILQRPSQPHCRWSGACFRALSCRCRSHRPSSSVRWALARRPQASAGTFARAVCRAPHSSRCRQRSCLGDAVFSHPPARHLSFSVLCRSRPV